MKRAILYYGNPLLRVTAKKVEHFDDSLRSLHADMVETLAAAKGIGLAAPQVGESRRIVIIQLPEAELITLVNPVLSLGSEIADAEECCLSIPSVEALVYRPITVQAQAQDLEGKPFSINASGLLARVIQHEVDHLNGVLFVDRLGSATKSLLGSRLRRLGERLQKSYVP